MDFIGIKKKLNGKLPLNIKGAYLQVKMWHVTFEAGFGGFLRISTSIYLCN